MYVLSIMNHLKQLVAPVGQLVTSKPFDVGT